MTCISYENTGYESSNSSAQDAKQKEPYVKQLLDLKNM